MAKTLDDRQVTFSYVVNDVLESNLVINGFDYSQDDEDNAITTPTTNYQTKLTINYVLKDSDKNILAYKGISHLSDLSLTMLTAEQVTEWVTNNRNNFILTDKANLSGYQPS